MENIFKSVSTKTINELMIILSVGFIFTLMASSYNFFDAVVLFIENHTREGVWPLIVFTIYTSFGMGIFSLRRWIELEDTLHLYRKAADSLQEKDKMYRALFEQSNDAVIISDGTKVLDLNKKSCEIFGFGGEVPHNTSLQSLIPGSYTSEFQQSLRDTFKQGSSRFEMKYTKPDGNTIDMEVCSSLIDKKDKIIQVVAQDITDRKNAERLEQEIQERLKTVLDNTLCGILLIESSTRKIVNANPAALKTIGSTEKELLGKVCNMLICPAGEERCITFSSDQAGDLAENVLIKAGGERIPILRSVVPVSIGGISYFVESFIDLSERKKAEEEILQAKIEAEGANRSMSEFLATISHELRTPLSAIIGFSDLLLEDTEGKFAEKNHRFLSNISNSGKHLLLLINSILDLSKIEAGEMKLGMESFSLHDVFTDTMNVISPIAMKKNISLNFEVESGLFISADRIRFKQILYNLVHNGIKFTPTGGSVEVLASRSKKGIRIAVSDTGIGISKEDQKQLFKPFKQIDSTLKREYEGTGLGLFLVKKFVEMHGGSIWVESEPGKGSSFMFEMPVEVVNAGENIGYNEKAFSESPDEEGFTVEPTAHS